ncbi:MAG: pyruvate kinase [Candidatus Hodarchaeota archaeon]
MEVFLTIPPDSAFIEAISTLSMVKGFRFNTGLELPGEKEGHLAEYKRQIGDKDLWIDLKCRELKVLNRTELTLRQSVLEINQPIDAKPPFSLYYNEAKNYVEVEKIIEGNKLQVFFPPSTPDDFKITFGKGASLNIPEARIIGGYLTERDKEYIRAGRSLGIHTYCLSFVENKSDIEQVLELDPDARIIAKIETPRGLNFIKTDYASVKDRVRLMAARGDLYVEIDRPHKILSALKMIIELDDNAIAASRLLQSVLNPNQLPNCAELSDVALLLKLGYKAFLFGDYVCEDEDALKSAIGILMAIEEQHKRGEI